MTMIVREMIVLDQECFKSSSPLEFSDDSGWLGPPRAVPFAWEVAPGTPKQEKCSNSSPSPSPDPSTGMESEAGLMADETLHQKESGRHSIHILETAPQVFLVARKSEVCGDLVNLSSEGAVPFKWEMEPGIPRDPNKCRQILECPLTPPPVLHSKSLVIHSSFNKRNDGNKNISGRISLAQRMRSLLWIHPHRPRQQDFLMRAGPGPEIKSKVKAKVLLLKDSPESFRSQSGKKKCSSEDGHSDEEDLSPVSVLEYNNSLRLSGSGNKNDTNGRLSSASSSVRSFYHTPKESFSWTETSSPNLSSSRSLKSVASREASSKKNSLYSLLALKNKLMLSKRENHHDRSSTPGCLMMLSNQSNRDSSFTSEEANLSDFNSSTTTSDTKSSSLCASDSSSPSLPEEEGAKQSKVSEAEHELSSDEDGHSVYFSPAPKLQHSSFSFHPDTTINFSPEKADAQATSRLKGFDIIERVDSLETIDPGFAPSEIGDEKYQSLTILNRMTSCARWQRREPSAKARGSQLAKSLFGRARVTVCCYVPAREAD